MNTVFGKFMALKAVSEADIPLLENLGQVYLLSAVDGIISSKKSFCLLPFCNK